MLRTLSVSLSFLLLTACGLVPDYQGPNEPADEMMYGVPVSETTYPASFHTGNLDVRYDLKLSKEVFYRGLEKDESTALREFRIDRNTSASLSTFLYQGAYPSHVSDYQYNVSEPALTGLWQFDAKSCQLTLSAKNGDLLMRLQGEKGEYTLDYKQGGRVTEAVMVFDIVEHTPDSAALERLWQRGHFYSTSDFVRCGE